MTPRLRRMTAREVESILHKHGFQMVSQKGSHQKWRHPESGLQVIVPEHRGRLLPVGTLHNILTNADIPEEEYKS